MPLTTSVLHDDAVTLLVLDGELDLAVSSQLDAAVEELLAEERVLVLVDVGRLRFCDSSGLGALLHAHRLLTAAGGTLVLAGARGAVERLLDLTSLAEALPVERDVQLALARLRRAASEASSGG